MTLFTGMEYVAVLLNERVLFLYFVKQLLLQEAQNRFKYFQIYTNSFGLTIQLGPIFSVFICFGCLYVESTQLCLRVKVINNGISVGH